jgi:hypothetical protein
MDHSTIRAVIGYLWRRPAYLRAAADHLERLQRAEEALLNRRLRDDLAEAMVDAEGREVKPR